MVRDDKQETDSDDCPSDAGHANHVRWAVGVRMSAGVTELMPSHPDEHQRCDDQPDRHTATDAALHASDPMPPASSSRSWRDLTPFFGRSRVPSSGAPFRYRKPTYAVVIRPDDEIHVGNGGRFRVLAVVPMEDEDSQLAGLLQVGA